MKKLITIIALSVCCLSTQAQTTNTPPSFNLWDYLTTGSNYFGGVYTSINLHDHSIGGGAFIGYHVSDIINPVIDLDYYEHSFYAIAATAEIQLPRNLLGKIPVRPFVAPGMAMAFSGLGHLNGELLPVMTAGANCNLGWLWQPLEKSSLLAGWQKRWNISTEKADNVIVGATFKFAKW